ncbi:MAG: hypothetical protein LKJ18_02960 [Ancrocorticia sp.]|jgi:hypothetical protein|nr:hypothetical protein [Ancrocorticia sp.]
MPTKTSLNASWEFRRAADTTWTEVSLPHDAMIEETRSAQADAGPNTGFYPGGSYIYRKKLPAARGAHNWLEFEGCYGRTRVLLNGNLLATHAHGYTSFVIPLPSEFTAQESALESAPRARRAPYRWHPTPSPKPQ